MRNTTKLLVIGAPGTSTSSVCDRWLAATCAHIGADIEEGDRSADSTPRGDAVAAEAPALTRHTYIQRAPPQRVQLLEARGWTGGADAQKVLAGAAERGVLYIVSQDAVATGLEATLADEFERLSADAGDETIVFVIFERAKMPTAEEAEALHLVQKQLLERTPSRLREQTAEEAEALLPFRPMRSLRHMFTIWDDKSMARAVKVVLCEACQARDDWRG